MSSVGLTWFGMLTAIFIAFATIAHAAKTDPSNVRAYGAVHGVVIPPFSR